MSLPSVSIVTVCYNPDLNIWNKSLKAIHKQIYSGKIEHIVMDGGSTNGSDKIAKRYGCKIIKLADLKNFALKRMSLGIKKAKGEIVLILEPDNIIVGKKWLQQMVQPFVEDKSVIGTFSKYNTYEKSMPVLTRYYNLFGVNDTILHYLNKSEKLPLYKDEYNFGAIVKKSKAYTTIVFNEKNLPTLGDNGHMVRREIINKVNKNPNTFLHTDAFFDLLSLGYNRYGAVNNSIIHYTGSNILHSFKKRVFFKNTFSKYKRTYFVFNKSSKKDVINVILFGFYTITIIQPLYESLRGYLFKRETAWFLHPIMCFGTLFSYLYSVISNSIGTFVKRYAI